MMKNSFGFSLVLVCLFIGKCYGNTELLATISQAGLKATVTFNQPSASKYVLINITGNISGTKWLWSVREFPVDYSKLENRCSDLSLGNVVYDLSSLLGELENDTHSFNISADSLPLIGARGVWSRSLHFKESSGSNTACASLMASGTGNVKVAEAFYSGESGVTGRVLIQWLGSVHYSDAVMMTELRHLDPKTPRSDHHWRIYTTDILDSEADKARSDCNSLQVMLLDLTARIGPVSIGKRSLIRDQYLPVPDLANKQRNHYLVLIDNDHPDTFLTCARLVLKPPILLRALINSNGVKGWFSFEQLNDLSPTRVTRNLTGAHPRTLGGFRIHRLPTSPPLGNKSKLDKCKNIGDVYNPTGKPLAADAPFPGEESQDKYAVGDLSGKVGYDTLREWDSFLPLTGKDGAFFRTLVIYRNGPEGVEEPWICSTILHYQPSHPNRKVLLIAAEAIYRYPLVGRIVFYQRPGPGEEVTILVEGLVHADGTSLNTTMDHRWGIAIKPPGADFFNWTARCVSAGPLLNPFKLDVNKTASGVVGALSDRLDRITIAGSKTKIQISREMWRDRMISLQGSRSVLGKSLVIFDDFGPKARGDRLACSKVTSIFRRKAVARDWFGNGNMTSVSGKIEFYQENEYTSTDVEINIDGLKDISTYTINMAPVLEILEFPCEETTLYGTYTPHEVVAQGREGSELTPDTFPAGDLSNKYGLLPPAHAEAFYNDSTLVLFGQTSLLAHSVVLHDFATKARFACATIERGYAPAEAREIRAIASFHHPDGFAFGYVKMTQLIHYDGSSSETVIEVNLRHPGKQDRNVTTGHNWAIYVNPVGVDAAVKILHTRCTAAGYIWNPYYTQLADPLNDDLYRQECGEDLPLRCYVGDLSGRLGPIDLGKGRKVFSDPNFPLEGKVSALGKSIVILNKDGGHEKFACANIEPDYDTVKYVNLRRPPKFVVSQFLEDVREVMGIPDWFLTVDSRKTNVLYNGACIQLFVHFKGPHANKLEQDFSRLLATGRLASSSIWIPGYIPTKKKPTTIGHKLCPSGYSSINNPSENEYDVTRSSKSASPSVIIPSLILFVISSVVLSRAANC